MFQKLDRSQITQNFVRHSKFIPESVKDFLSRKCHDQNHFLKIVFWLLNRVWNGMEIGRLLKWKKIKASVILICLLANHLSGLLSKQSDVPLVISVCEIWRGHRKAE